MPNSRQNYTKSLRLRLQYLYTIGVFFGVLVTSYLMMTTENNFRLPVTQTVNENYRPEMVTFDSGMSQLFETEDALRRLTHKPNPRAERVPTGNKSKSKKLFSEEIATPSSLTAPVNPR